MALVATSGEASGSIGDLDGNGQDVFYDAIPDYRRSRGGEPNPLDESWLDEFQRGIEDTQADFALVISERPVQFKVDQRSSTFPNVAVRRFKWEHSGTTYRQVVVVDLSGIHEEELVPSPSGLRLEHCSAAPRAFWFKTLSEGVELGPSIFFYVVPDASRVLTRRSEPAR